MNAAIDVRELSFDFDDGTRALNDVSFRVERGQRVALVGPNGAGKSTLLLHLAGVLPEEGAGGRGEGAIFVLGQALQGNANAVRRNVGLLFQDPDDQLFCATVGEDVAFGPEQLGLRGEDLRSRVHQSLERVGLAGIEHRLPHRLSAGEKKRVALAGLLAYGPSILAFDEPTSGLDPRARRQLIDLLGGIEATQVMATHDLALALEVCPRTIVLDQGRIVADGPTRSLLQDDEQMRMHGLEVPRRDLPRGLLTPANRCECGRS